MRTSCHNQPVVVEAGSIAEENASVLLTAQDAAQWGWSLAGRKRSGGDLIEQRLKQVIVVPNGFLVSVNWIPSARIPGLPSAQSSRRLLMPD
jgi:hypothetical protein